MTEVLLEASSTFPRAFEELDDHFGMLLIQLKTALVQQKVSVDDVQLALQVKFKLLPFEGSGVTLEKVYSRVINHCCVLYYRMPYYIAKTLLLKDSKIVQQFGDYEVQVEQFSRSTKMENLVNLVKNKRKESAESADHAKFVVLRVREYWEKVTFNKFERFTQEIFGKLYDYVSRIQVVPGSMYVSWVIPDSAINEMFHHQPLDFIEAVGVISLHIGRDTIYSLRNDHAGCKLMEAALLQAIELNNRRAVDIFMAAGCNPEIASFVGQTAVTFVAHIRSCASTSSLPPEYICFLEKEDPGAVSSISPLSLANLVISRSENELAQAKEKCRMLEKLYQNALQENETLRKAMNTGMKIIVAYSHGCMRHVTAC